MTTITIEKAAAMLAQQDHILVLMHKSPDGDAIGCAYGLCKALRKMGKQAQPLCSDPISARYDYLTSGFEVQHFDPAFIVSVDLADTKLLGDALMPYADRIDLCIDHHGSNTGFARYGTVDASAAACAQLLIPLIKAMGAVIDKPVADAVFTGITTDTGCFKFSNTNADTHHLAAEMIECGADSAMINRIMFDTKSRERLDLEKRALETLRYACDGKIAVISITAAMMQESGAEDSDMDGIASIPRQIQGVKVGITVKEKENGVFKISVRTTDDVDACAICKTLGGGGHRAASGCSVAGTLEEATRRILAAAETVLEEQT